jgi:hypothetical protein
MTRLFVLYPVAFARQLTSTSRVLCSIRYKFTTSVHHDVVREGIHVYKSCDFATKSHHPSPFAATYHL